MEMFDTVDEIVNNTKRGFQMLIKFSNSLDNLKSLQKGTLYMKSLRFYNELEDIEGSGRPDKYDGKWAIKDVHFTFTNNENPEESFSAESPVATISMGYENSPVFCLFSFDYRNCQEENIDYENGTIIIPVSFSEEQHSRIEKGLGQYALLVTNTNEFLKRVTSALSKHGIEYRIDLVKYTNGNSLERAQSILGNPQNIAFHKNPKEFAYQQELRILITNNPIDEPQNGKLVIPDVGDLSDITQIMTSKELLSNYSIKFTQHFVKAVNR